MRATHTKTGLVYLIGAGPGDPTLFTLKGKMVLEIADVVIYDYLANDILLEYAPQAEKIYVGKKAGCHTLSQTEINRLLVEKAQTGHIVARLKGGDVFVFGRGGEEALALQKAKIPFVIVPGISSSIAAPAYAGIPVTHRQLATSFAVITGHEAITASSNRWKKWAYGIDTLVFLMGVANLSDIIKELLAGGKAPQTPLAAIRWGTYPYQATFVTTLGEAEQFFQTHSLKPPAVIVIGPTVTLRSQLQWFDKLPLFGKNFILTRAAGQISQLAEKLSSAGGTCFSIPTIEFAPPTDDYRSLDDAIAQLSAFSWLIFTSVNGVQSFFHRLHAIHHLDSRALANCQIATIGSATAKALRQFGLKADLIPATFTAEGLLKDLQPRLFPNSQILLVRAEKARPILPEQLQKAGHLLHVAIAYRTLPATANKEYLLTTLQNKKIDMLTFTSSSTVENFLTILGQENQYLLQDIAIATIGPITAQTCREHGLTVTCSAKPHTISALVEVIKNYYKVGEGISIPQ